MSCTLALNSAQRSSWSWRAPDRRRRIHGHARRSVRRAALAARHQVIGGRLSLESPSSRPPRARRRCRRSKPTWRRSCARLNCTWSPAEITVGVAVSCAVGAGAVAGGAVAAGGGRGCALFAARNSGQGNQKEGEINRLFRSFKGVLLSQKTRVNRSGQSGFVSPQLAASRIRAPIKS